LTCILNCAGKYNANLGSFTKGLTTKCRFEFAHVILLGTPLNLHICCPVEQNENSPLGHHLSNFLKATSGPSREKRFAISTEVAEMAFVIK
jgi:hypothetical protein